MPVRMVLVREKVTSAEEMQREGRSPVHRWWEWKLVQPSWKQCGWSTKKLKTELLSHSAIPFLAIHPKELKLGS
jgi:hypothetical protein